MRELKFRAWDEENKNIVYALFKEEGIGELRQGELIDRYDIVMQYTGLKDKNKREVYFDDIFRTKYGIGVIVWMDDRLGIASGKIGEYHAVDEISKKEIEDGEVIGNIYENPELF